MHVACHYINQAKKNQAKLPAIKSIQVAMHVTRIEACACSMPPNQSKLPGIKSIHVAMHACHSDRHMYVTRIEACSMPPHNSIQVASHQINPSCHACHSDRYMHVTRIDASMSLGSRHACSMPLNQSKLPAIKSIQVAMHVTRIEACMQHATKSIQVASHQINPSCHACHADRGMHAACHQINPSCHACHSDRCKHVTQIDASMSLIILLWAKKAGTSWWTSQLAIPLARRM
jgi:hypothetical protein